MSWGLSMATSSETPALAIGSKTWPGLAKLAEEAGELVQVIAKLAAYPDSPHPDGSDLRERLIEEMGDVLAAAEFVEEANALPLARLHDRRTRKLNRFRRWHREELAAASGGGEHADD
jgi:NTP pyrophosphatase (non-canonical NTP hydrolase)